MKLKLEGFTVYKVHDNLFQRGKMHNLDLVTVRQALNVLSVRVVVGLAPNQVDYGLVKLHNENLIKYYHVPIADGILHEDTIRWMEVLAGILAKYTLRDKGVLCHCNAGRNRSGLLNAMIIRERLHCTGAEAMEMVRSARPNAIANENYVNYLESLGRAV